MLNGQAKSENNLTERNNQTSKDQFFKIGPWKKIISFQGRVRLAAVASIIA
jgi:hypothetical protein